MARANIAPALGPPICSPTLLLISIGKSNVERSITPMRGSSLFLVSGRVTISTLFVSRSRV